jgi:OmcA/MtrC family decaheme c-type cytochrome
MRDAQRSMNRMGRAWAVGLVLVVARSAAGVTLAGGGPGRTDCLVELLASGIGFPGGRAVFKGTTCADGDPCDADGVRDGSCLFTPVVCLNQADPGLPKCSATQVRKVRFKAKKSVDTSGLDAAVAAIGLPSSASTCSAPVELVVPVAGPNKKGELLNGKVKIQAKASTTKGADKDKYQLVCRPGSVPVVTTSTTAPGETTSTTTLPGGTPGAGLDAAITGAALSPGGQVTVTFHLSDATGTPVTPTTASTSDPNQARVRFTLARIELDVETKDGFTTTFPHYVNYVTTHVTGGGTSSDQPTFDTTGTFALVDAGTSTWTYTFGRTLPAGFPTDLTHTVGAQIERTVEGVRSVANPVLDFVPNGSAVTTVIEDTTTAQCNSCHDPLQAHGGGRREVKLCVLCHTDQAIDPDSANTLDFKHMVHRLHMGKDLPTVTAGPVGTKYAFIGFGGAETVFAEKINVCAGGPFESAPCTVNADCGTGTCTGTGVDGVGFPQDIRNCTKCHGQGATAASFRQLPSALACTGCHDDVNPGETALNGLAPGEGHLPGPQPEAFCRICHKDVMDSEFDITVPGAHVIETRSATLAGLQGEILSASGTPNNPVQVQFRLRDGAGNPLTMFTGLNRIGFAISGSTTDYGGASTPLISPTAFGGGATGTLVGPDGIGLATYTTSTNLPADASGTWAVGLEARRSVTVNGVSVSEAAIPNPILTFSVDGSAVKARRMVVDGADCSNCHGTFSKDFSIHGNLRNNVQYCPLCHNASVTDFGRRKSAVASGADANDQPIVLKHLIHKIHRGEALETQPYIVYGFGAAPKNYTAIDFGDVRFPGDLRNCSACHSGTTYQLPLPAGVLPTVHSIVSGGVETVVDHVPPTQDACLACHDSDAAAAHAATNTTGSGGEACAVCHGEGAVAAVSTVHAQ